LAALGGKFDIEAISPQGIKSAIEVKYIGEEVWQFGANLKSLQSGKAVAGSFSDYSGYNYILFRIYQAAKQFEDFSGDRYVFIVISNLTWGYSEMAIECNWIRHPLHFFEFSKWKGNVPHSFAESINKYLNPWHAICFSSHAAKIGFCPRFWFSHANVIHYLENIKA